MSIRAQSLAALLPVLPIYVERYGAAGDGVTDDHDAIQRAIDAAAPYNGSVVFNGGKTYAVTTAPLDVPSGVTIEGNGALIKCTAMAGATALNQVFGITIEGSIGASVALTASNIIGDKAIAVSTTGLAVGDIVLVSSNQTHPVGAVGATTFKGEMHRIRSIDSASALTIMDGLFLSYDYTQAAIVRKITQRTGVRIRNLRVQMGGVGKAHNGILMQYAENCWLENCGVTDAEDCGVRLQYCFGGGVTCGEFRNATSPADGGGPVLGVTGYGVLVGSGARNVTVEKADFRNCRHAVAGGGTHPPVLVDILYNNIDGSRTDPAPHSDLDCHEDCMWWTFRGNRISGSLDANGSGGIGIRGQKCVVDGNFVINARQHGIVVTHTGTNPNGLDKTRVINNVVTGARFSGIYVFGKPGTPLRNIEVVHNTVESSGDGILFQSINGGIVSDNTVINVLNANQSGIRFLGASGDPITDIVCNNNRVDGTTLYGLLAQYVERMTVGGLVAKNLGNAAVYYANCTNISHTGGQLTTTGATINGITVSDCSKMLLSGVVATGGGTPSSSMGIWITGVSSDVCVSGGVFSAYQYPVRAATGTLDYVTVIGINGRNCGAAVELSAVVNKVNTGNL